jgi:hypothetical protein
VYFLGSLISYTTYGSVLKTICPLVSCPPIFLTVRNRAFIYLLLKFQLLRLLVSFWGSLVLYTTCNTVLKAIFPLILCLPLFCIVRNCAFLYFLVNLYLLRLCIFLGGFLISYTMYTTVLKVLFPLVLCLPIFYAVRSCAFIYFFVNLY